MEINKWDLTILGTKYPKVYGFYFNKGSGTINGFSIQKYGIGTNYMGDSGTIRNNYFYNCGISLGNTGYFTIINNQIIGGTIELYEAFDVTIKGTIFSKSKCGIFIDDTAMSIPTVTNCVFKNCGYAVYFYEYGSDPGYSDLGDSYLTNISTSIFSGNKYIGNKKNIGWGGERF